MYFIHNKTCCTPARYLASRTCPHCGQKFSPAESTAWSKKHCDMRCEYKANCNARLAA